MLISKITLQDLKLVNLNLKTTGMKAAETYKTEAPRDTCCVVNFAFSCSLSFWFLNL
jgi:hypothetical protein